MEAIAGLSLAANILQVVEFTANVLSAGRQISQAGSTVQNSELGVVVTDFTALNDRVKIWARPDPAALGPLAESGQALENLAVESGKIAKELISLLESLQAKPEASRYKSASQAIRTVWSADKINGLRNRLQTIRDELQFRILVSIREDQIQGVNEAGRKALQSVLDSNKALDTKITAQTTEITRRQETEGQLAAQRHGEVLGAISRQRITTVVLEDVTETIKSELFFTRKDDRFEDIAVAHQQTFQWALEDTTPADWPSLVEWLREGSSVYWIAGKAGSGKSTLMKYLHQDKRMAEALKNWAGEKRLIILDFYFWNSGAGIQKSQEGLFRSLLWQVLDQDPTFGSLLFPEQYLPGARWTEFPTFHQLRRAFGRLTRQRHDATKIAMIIDGLDEFDANRVTMSELAEMFLAATKQDNIKALLSSRPLTAFEDAFLDQPKLRLHQLTHNDITKYVHDRLAKHPRVVGLSPSSNEDMRGLIDDTVASAEGVFLWVKLVVNSLVEMLQNGDTVQDLQRELRSLPSDLERLFEHMLDSIPAEYKSHASRIFQLLRFQVRMEQRIYLIFSLTASMLLYAELSEADVLGAEIITSSHQELEEIYSVASRQVKSRSAGLLELRLYGTDHVDSDFLKERKGSKVTYLHRSVADYLAKEDVWTRVLAQNTDTTFSASRTSLKSRVMSIKRSDLSIGTWGLDSFELNLLWAVVESALEASRSTESTTGTSPVALLDELDRVLSTQFDSQRHNLSPLHGDPASWKTWYDSRTRAVQSDRDNFLALATIRGLDLYVKEKIKRNGIWKEGRPLLQYALLENPGLNNFFSHELVCAILQQGVNPNEEFNGESAWKLALDRRRFGLRQWIKILETLLLHGADPDAPTRLTPNEIERGSQAYLYSPLHILTDFFEDTSHSYKASPSEVRMDQPEEYLRRHLRLWMSAHDEKPISFWETTGFESIVKDEAAKMYRDWAALKKLLLSKGAKDITWVSDNGGGLTKVGKQESKFKSMVSKPLKRIETHVLGMKQKFKG